MDHKDDDVAEDNCTRGWRTIVIGLSGHERLEAIATERDILSLNA